MVDDSNKPESSALMNSVSTNKNVANQNDSSAADVEMSQYVADRARVNEDKIRQDEQIVAEFGEYNYGWHDSDAAGEAAKKGIDESVVRAISADKHEPEWMLNLRLQGYRAFLQKPMPDWGVDLRGFDADDFKYYVRPVHDQAKTWDDLQKTFAKLTIGLVFQKRRKSAWFRALQHSTSRKLFTIRFVRI